jgi:DNA repair protein RadC
MRQNILDDLTTKYKPGLGPIYNCPEIIAKELQDVIGAKKEIFIIFYLDTKLRVIAREIVSIGILNASLIHPREVFRGAIIHAADSIIMAHNHPSGDPEPSLADREVTKLLKKAGELLGIPVKDHVIVTTTGFYSFKDKGELL